MTNFIQFEEFKRRSWSHCEPW